MSILVDRNTKVICQGLGTAVNRVTQTIEDAS